MDFWKSLLVASVIAVSAVAIVDASAVNATPITDWCVSDAFGANQLPCGVRHDDVFTGLDPTHFAGGTFTIDSSGNTDATHINNVLAAINYETGSFINLTAVANGLSGNGSGFTFTPNLNGTSFSWSYSGSAALAFLTVKAANGFALYDILGLTSGSINLASCDGGTEYCLTNNGGQVPTSRTWTSGPTPLRRPHRSLRPCCCWAPP